MERERALIKILIKRKSFRKQGGPKKKVLVGEIIEEKKKETPNLIAGINN